MVVEALLKLFLGIADFFLDMIPVVDLTGVIGSVVSFLEFLDAAAYFFPVGTVAAIISVIVLEESVKISVSIGRLILRLIPFIG